MNVFYIISFKHHNNLVQFYFIDEGQRVEEFAPNRAARLYP